MASEYGQSASAPVEGAQYASNAQEALDSFFNLSIDMLCIADFNGYFVRLNPAFHEILGYPDQELLSRPFLEFVHPDDRAATIAETERLVTGGDTISFENRYLCCDGSYKWLLWNASSDSARRLIYATAHDITARKQMEEEIRKAQQFWTSIVENIPHMIFVKEAQSLCFVGLNKGGEKLLGLSRQDMIGKSDYDFFPRDEADFFVTQDRMVLEGRSLVDIPEEPIQTHQGIRFLHTKKIPIFDEAGQPQYLLGISEDITERKQAAAALQKAKDAAEAASRTKSEFLANMSHELRTPLNAIIGFSEILEDQVFGPLNSRQAKYVTNILSSGRHLLQLINDILDISKIEAGRLTLDRVPFSVEAALNDVMAIVRALANKKNIRLTVEAAPDLPYLHADQAKFKQIMYNLMSNAIKFTPPEGRVTVSAVLDVPTQPDAPDVDATPPAIRICVADSGIGIKPEDQERIFREFEQVDSSYARLQQGTGLGLALTKTLIELHGGRIWVESDGVEGAGSRFTFVLPLEPPQEKHGDTSANGSLETPSGGSRGEPGTPTPSPQPCTPLVLVVEDNEAASELLAHYLVEAGYAVAHATDGEQAVRMAKELHPYAVTLDIMLPEKDGWEVLTELKADLATADVPVIIVSITEDRQLGFSLGAVDFLVKPVEKSRLVEAIAKAGASAGQPLTVLVVDDEPQTVEYLTDLLQQQNWRVLQAYGGQQGIEIAMQRLPQVIVLDLMMPDVTGFDVVCRLREQATTKDIPIIIFSAKDVTEEDCRRLRNDIQAIISKSGKEDLLHELQKLSQARH